MDTPQGDGQDHAGADQVSDYTSLGVETQRYDPPKIISYTLTLYLERLQSCNPTLHSTMNSLECHICAQPIGRERPIGIAWGKFNHEPSSHGMRLCHRCYTHALKEQRNAPC